jgi:hypothetical protein
MNDTEHIETKALELRHSVTDLVVEDQPTFEAGEALRATIKSCIKAVKDHFKGPKSEAKARHAKICDAEKRHLGELQEVESDLRSKLFAYTEEQRRIAEEAARKAAEEARRQAEEERLARAEQLEKQGQNGAAEATLAAPVPEIAAPRVEVPKVKGSRKVYSYEIADKRAFVEACLKGEGSLSLACICDDSKVLGSMVRAQKDAFDGAGVVVSYREVA